MSNRALDSAKAKGAKAAKDGDAITSNPYGDARTHRGAVTFARAFWRAWVAGYREYLKERK